MCGCRLKCKTSDLIWRLQKLVSTLSVIGLSVFDSKRTMKLTYMWIQHLISPTLISLKNNISFYGLIHSMLCDFNGPTFCFIIVKIPSGGSFSIVNDPVVLSVEEYSAPIILSL